jgi:CheY-like chemotaxis protein/HPt (histidine-containing phosphotransfer) domain-containing protein
LSALQGLSVLIVDDNATNRRILEVQLTGWGMHPVLAKNAAAALEEIRQAAAAGAPFEMVISDLHMPDIDGAQLTELIRQTPKGDDLKVIIMSSARREDYGKQNADADAYLMKPVKASQLLDTVRSVLGKNGVPDEPARPRSLSSPNPGRVLVAEDSAVNQELMKRLLIKWGHSVVVANNGLKALSLLETESFDVVLMDVQMPELNGFEATATIRNKERGTDAHIPIIALTAHALKGDREKCIAAGMDDYISKPIEADKLFTAIEAAIAGVEKPHNNGHSPGRGFDAAALMRNLDGDLELLRALAEIFASAAPTQLSVIETAIANQDAEALMRGAHTLKGSVATFQARAAVDSAATLEKIGGSGDLSSAASEFNRLRSEIARLTVALNEMLTGAAK